MTDLMPRAQRAVHEPVAETWPTLARPRSNPVRRYGAATAIRLIAKDLPATIHLDSNRSYGLGGPSMRVHRTAASCPSRSRNAAVRCTRIDGPPRPYELLLSR